MNVHTTTIKDKEVSRWRPLHRLPHGKLTPKRAILLLFALFSIIFVFTHSLSRGVDILDTEENDDDVLQSLKKELKGLLTTRADHPSKQRDTAIFVTANTLYNTTRFTDLACEMSLAKKLNVLIMYMGINSSDTVPFTFRANHRDKANCPVVWHDARHEYSSVYKQLSATEEILKEAVDLTRPSVVVYLDDEEDWFMQSLEKAVYWRRPAISLIQLKRGALANLRWIASLSPAALVAWNFPQIDVVITTSQENTGTLYRLIESLLNAEYIQPSLPRLFITFNPNTTTPAILTLLKKWPADRLILRHQIAPLHTSWPGALQSWYPSDDDNYVLVLQDDVELSPWYMYWLHLSLMRYIYSSPMEASSLSLLTGISLQSAYAKDQRTLDIRNVLLMAPMYAGWLSYATPYVWQSTLFHSTLFFPAQWREFHTYISLREYFGGGMGSITEDLSSFTGRSLTLEMYWLELLLARGYAILYPNFDDSASFAVQHIESPTSETIDEIPLLQWGAFFEQIEEGLPEWEDLPVLDYEKRVVGWDQLERSSRKYQGRLSMCENLPEDKWQVRDLFCFPEEEGYRHRVHEEVHHHKGKEDRKDA